jgi:hypothetical protein
MGEGASVTNVNVRQILTPPNGYCKKRDGLEIFSEFDEGDGLTGGYWLAHVPMEFGDLSLL